jgi:hypothetical protein
MGVPSANLRGNTTGTDLPGIGSRALVFMDLLCAPVLVDLCDRKV